MKICVKGMKKEELLKKIYIRILKTLPIILRLKVNYCLKIITRISHLFKIFQRNMLLSKLRWEPIKTELMELKFKRNNLSMLVILMLKI